MTSFLGVNSTLSCPTANGSRMQQQLRACVPLPMCQSVLWLSQPRKRRCPFVPCLRPGLAPEHTRLSSLGGNRFTEQMGKFNCCADYLQATQDALSNSLVAT